MGKPKAIVNAMIYDFERFYENGYVLFDEKIIASGPMTEFTNQEYEIIDGKGSLVLPGFVVGHTHVYSTFARGWMNTFEYEDFMDILKSQWWKLDRNLQDDAIHYSGIVSGVDHLKHGVTTLIDHHASGEIPGSLMKLKTAITDTVGLRGLYAFETSDRFHIKSCIDENIGFMQHGSAMHGGLFGLHASLSLSEQTLRTVKAQLKDAPIHIHVAESELDQEDAFINYGERVVERLDRHGLINPDAIITHALFIDENEARILKQRNAVVALNPSSNMNNGVGLPNYALLKRHDIPVIIGNDGLGASITNEYMNIFYATHLKENNPDAFTLDDLKAVIDTAYQYVSRRLGIKIGRFKRGYQADLQIVPYIPPTPINEQNAMGHLFFGLFQSFRPKDVYIDGKVRLENYEVSANLRNEYKAARTHAQQVWDRAEKEGEHS